MASNHRSGASSRGAPQQQPQNPGYVTLQQESAAKGLTIEQYALAERIFRQLSHNGKIDFNALNNIDQGSLKTGNIAPDVQLKFRTTGEQGALLGYNEFLAVFKVLFT
jgi:hypothetical protein